MGAMGHFAVRSKDLDNDRFGSAGRGDTPIHVRSTPNTNHRFKFVGACNEVPIADIASFIRSPRRRSSLRLRGLLKFVLFGEPQPISSIPTSAIRRESAFSPGRSCGATPM